MEGSGIGVVGEKCYVPAILSKNKYRRVFLEYNIYVASKAILGVGGWKAKSTGTSEVTRKH